MEDEVGGRGGAALGSRTRLAQAAGGGGEDGLALMARRSASSSFSPVRGSVPLSLMYLRMRRRS